MSREDGSSFEDTRDPRVIAKILGIPAVPTDKRKNALVHIKSVRVALRTFPPGFYGLIHTPKVAACGNSGNVLHGKTKRGIDDFAYKNHTELQRIIPRCYSILRIFRKSDDVCVAKHILQGYYKFGGSAKDEDSNVSTSGLFEQAPLHKATRVVLSEKSNGKAAVLTMFEFQGQLYVFGGSKGVHYVVRENKKDREGDFRGFQTNFAKSLLLAFFRDWDQLSQENRELFAAHLIGSDHDDGYTACGEFEDGKHMVPLPPKSRPVVKMFGLVANRGAIPVGETFCEDVVSTIQWFSDRGFKVIHVETKTPNEVERLRNHLRAGKMKEGFVLHWQMQDKKTGSWITIAVEKYKIWWYILLRVVREFLKGFQHKGFRDWEHLLWKRLQKRNNDFMYLPDEFLKLWYNLLCRFIQWFLNHKFERNTNIIDINSDSEGMGNVWCRFVQETNANDDFLEPEAELAKRNLKFVPHPKSTRTEESTDDFKSQDRFTESKTQSAPTQPQQQQRADFVGLLVVFQGLPGMGKTTITNGLCEEMQKRGISARGLEQDPFAEKHGIAKSGKYCIAAFEKLVHEGDYQVIFLQRNNANYGQYSKYARIAGDNGWKTHIITPKHILYTPHLTLVCLQSVRQRSPAKDHPTFKRIDLTKQLQITMSFYGAFTPGKKARNIELVSEVDWLKPGTTDIPLPAAVDKYFHHYVGLVRKSRNPYDVAPLPAEEVVPGLGLESEDYQQWRRTPADIAMEVTERLMETSLRGVTPRQRTPVSPPAALSPNPSPESEVTHVSNEANPSTVNQPITAPPNVNINKLPNKNALFISLMIPENYKQLLRDYLKKMPDFDVSGLVQEKLHHLTLIYKTARVQRPELWIELSEMAGRELYVIVTGVALSPGRICCFACELFSENGIRQGESLLRLVESGHPHITACHANGIAPVESLQLLKRLATRTALEGERYARIPQEEFILIPAKVSVNTRGGGKNFGAGRRRKQRGRH